MTTSHIAISIGLALLVILAVLLAWYSMPRLNRRKRLQQINVGFYPPAWAGHPKDGELVESVSVETNIFTEKDGTPINPENYYKYVVKGNSMQFCGIRDMDLIFVKKGFRIPDLEMEGFPYILVLKDTTKRQYPQYKLRRAWCTAQFGEDRFERDVRAIMASEAFQEIKELTLPDGKPYKGDEEMLGDFMEVRLPKYEKRYIDCSNPDAWNRTVVISTTFDTDSKAIHFSIHPISCIVGIVKDAFTVA